MSDYQPISCASHEQLEFAALRKQWLDLSVDGVVQHLLPLDVYAHEGEEWLRAQNKAGETLTIRLDRLSF